MNGSLVARVLEPCLGFLNPVARVPEPCMGFLNRCLVILSWNHKLPGLRVVLRDFPVIF